jgi:hypothetical protein
MLDALCTPLGHHAQEDICVAKRCRATRYRIRGWRSSRSIGIHSCTWRGIARVSPHRQHHGDGKDAGDSEETPSMHRECTLLWLLPLMI